MPRGDLSSTRGSCPSVRSRGRACRHRYQSEVMETTEGDREGVGMREEVSDEGTWRDRE